MKSRLVMIERADSYFCVDYIHIYSIYFISYYERLMKVLSVIQQHASFLIHLIVHFLGTSDMPLFGHTIASYRRRRGMPLFGYVIPNLYI